MSVTSAVGLTAQRGVARRDGDRVVCKEWGERGAKKVKQRLATIWQGDLRVREQESSSTEHKPLEHGLNEECKCATRKWQMCNQGIEHGLNEECKCASRNQVGFLVSPLKAQWRFFLKAASSRDKAATQWQKEPLQCLQPRLTRCPLSCNS